MRFGTYEASYDNLPRLLGVIEERNPGSSYEVKKSPSIEHPGKSVLQRAFLALHACKMAFVNCRPVLCIDGTFLTGKYRGQILTAIGVDGNNQVLPLAFAFVESENTDSWYWFLKLVKTKVVGMRPNVCLIHDRHAGILRAIGELQFGSMERGYPGVWEDVQSRWCMRHMGANFFKQFKNKELMNMFKRLCNQNQEKKFNELWKRLDELTAKCSDQRAAAPSTAVADPPQALGPLPTDSPTLVRRTGLEIRKFSQWILHEPIEKWAKAYDTGGARYGIMTTNLAEVYNWVMRAVRGLPLVGIVEFILHGTCRYFRDRFQAVLPSMPNNSILFGAFMQKKLEELRKKAMKHRALVQGTQQHRFEILCQDKAGRGIYRKRVKQECVLKDDGTCHCSCAKPKLLHRPCTHVIAAAAECGIPDTVYVSQYFSKQAIYHTWSGEIYGFGIAGEFTETNDEVLNIPDPSKLRGKAGRRRTRRIRNDMDESEAGRVKRCSKCDEHGHTYKHCPKDKEKPSAAEAGLSGSAADGARPTGEGTTSTRPRPRRRRATSGYVGAQLGTFRARTCGELLTVHDSFVERLREAGLLPMCRLVEAAAGNADPARRWTVDRSLVAALVDRWRPETHTFHLPCGEVAPTLQDVSYLLATFVEDWLLATEEVVDHEGEPHTEESYQAYLRWYQPRTRTRVTFAPLEQQPHVASTRDLYDRHRDQDFARVVDDINRVVVDGSTTIQRLDAGIPVPVEEHPTTYTRMVESMRSILRVLTCRADDVARADAAVQRPPVPTGPRPAAHVPRPTPPPHGGFRAPFSTPPSSARPFVVPPTGFAQFAMTQAAHFSQAAGSASQAAGTSSQGPPLDHAGTSSDPFLSSTVLFDITDFDFASGSTEDVIGPSQLGGAPPVQTQDQAQATPPRDTRATRAVPPDRFTYSQDHVRAQARRTKRGRGAGQGQ
uniref:OSJNBb0026I12.11 protein n=1 Tax=Oryza sativa subsp. japonica TaxID=39947 RepID=Q7XNW9_ORYSJ|nr:OSJNBb0026I12.11 [Oryza sativa Japonica Group]